MSTNSFISPSRRCLFEEIVGFMIKNIIFIIKNHYLSTQGVFSKVHKPIFHFKGDSNLKPYQFSYDANLLNNGINYGPNLI